MADEIETFRIGETVFCGELELVVDGPPDAHGLIPTRGYGNFAAGVLSRRRRTLAEMAQEAESRRNGATP